jgi:hypothetical protein
LVFTPPPHGSGRFELTLTAVATESEAGVPSARNAATFTVNLDPVLDAGTITGSAAGNEDSWITISPTFKDGVRDDELVHAAAAPSGVVADPCLSHPGLRLP